MSEQTDKWFEAANKYCRQEKKDRTQESDTSEHGIARALANFLGSGGDGGAACLLLQMSGRQVVIARAEFPKYTEVYLLTGDGLKVEGPGDPDDGGGQRPTKPETVAKAICRNKGTASGVLQKVRKELDEIAAAAPNA